MSTNEEQRLRDQLAGMADEIGPTVRPLAAHVERKARVRRGLNGSLTLAVLVAFGFFSLQLFQGSGASSPGLSPAGGPSPDARATTEELLTTSSTLGTLITTGAVGEDGWALWASERPNGDLCTVFEFPLDPSGGGPEVCKPGAEGRSLSEGTAALILRTRSVDGIGPLVFGHVEKAVDRVLVETPQGVVPVQLVESPLDEAAVDFFVVAPLPADAESLVAYFQGREVARQPLGDDGPCTPGTCGSEGKGASAGSGINCGRNECEEEGKTFTCDDQGCKADCPEGQDCVSHDESEGGTPQGEPCGDGPGCGSSSSGPEGSFDESDEDP